MAKRSTAALRLAAARKAKKRGRAPRGSQVTTARRREQVLDLMEAGASMRAIGRALKVNVSTVSRDYAVVMGALDELTVDHAEHHKLLELERLNAMHLGLQPRIKAGSPSAVQAAVSVSRRRAALLGLDAPIDVEATFDIPTEFTLNIGDAGNGNGKKKNGNGKKKNGKNGGNGK